MNTALALVAATLASYRLYRIIAKDEWPPAEWFRDRLKREAGEDSAWVTMFLCPWCWGSWVSLAVVSLTDYYVGLPVPVFCWLAVSCVVGLIGNYDHG